jgi:hypothetical protein
MKKVASMKTMLIWLSVLAWPYASALACYTVYDRSNAVVYHAMVPPVDMTPPYTDRLQKVFPGSHLVFGNNTSCPATQAGYNPTRATAVAPLFTDPQTAEGLKLEHTVLPSGAAVVRKPPANMRPGFSVINLGVVPKDSPDDGGAAALNSGPVITEMRDPPMTVIQDVPGRASRR